MASASLSNCEYLFSAGLNKHEAYTIGRSVPSSKICDNTAPTLKGEASQTNTIAYQTTPTVYHIA